MISLKKIYWAGDLFSFKALHGNAYLAAQVEKASGNRYLVSLPQTLKPREFIPANPNALRDMCLVDLLASDLALFSFDGAELDSGTVAEFLFAKFVDIPAVVIRSDFRAAGDNPQVPEAPWNLMLAGYPRTKLVLSHSLQECARHNTRDPQEAVELAEQNFAHRIVSALDEMAQTAPLIEKTGLEFLQNWVMTCSGIDSRLQDDVRAVFQKRLKALIS